MSDTCAPPGIGHDTRKDEDASEAYDTDAVGATPMYYNHHQQASEQRGPSTLEGSNPSACTNLTNTELTHKKSNNYYGEDTITRY